MVPSSSAALFGGATTRYTATGQKGFLFLIFIF
jgi:hypothetical protein